MNIRNSALATMAFSMVCFSLSTATPPGELATHLFPHKDGEAKQNTGGNQNDWLEVGRNGTVGWITYVTGGVDLSHTTGSALTIYIDKVYSAGTVKVFALTQPVTLAEMDVEGSNLFYNTASPVVTTAVAASDQEKVLRLDLGTLLNQGAFHGLVIEAAGSLRVDFGSKEGPVQPLIELRYAFATSAQVQQAIDAGIAAEDAASAAQLSATLAGGSAAAADGSATTAQGFSVLASQYAASAATSAGAASGSVLLAQGFATQAGVYSGEAAASAGTASGSALTAQTAAGEASGFAAAASVSADGAASSAGAAAGSALASAGSAAASEGSALAAAGSAGSALLSAGAAAGSANAAQTSAGAAAGYETDASNYAGQASGYATAAGASAGEAAGYAATAGAASGSCIMAAGAADESADAAAASAAAAAAASTGGTLPVGAALMVSGSTPPEGFVATGIRVNYESPWVSGASSLMGRYDLAATVMDGKLYSTGGYNGSSHINNVQAFDPIANTWTSLTGMPENIHLHTVTESGGHLYVIAGLRGDGFVYSGMYRYNPATNNWITLPSLPAPRYNHAAAAVNGKIYVIGGFGSFPSGSMTQTVYVYDVAGNTWSQAANLPTPRGALAATAADGKIYALGGRQGNSPWLNVTEIYNPSTNTWSAGAPMPVSRSHHSAVNDGQRIYVLGGQTSDVTINSVVQYDITGNTWMTMNPLGQGRYKFAAGLIDGKIYAAQGNGGGSILSSTEVYTLPKTLYLVEKAP